MTIYFNRNFTEYKIDNIQKITKDYLKLRWSYPRGYFEWKFREEILNTVESKQVSSNQLNYSKIIWYLQNGRYLTTFYKSKRNLGSGENI